MAHSPTHQRRNYEKYDNPRARELFKLYDELHIFDDEFIENNMDTTEKLRHNAVTNAASIIHDKAMELEYPNHIRR